MPDEVTWTSIEAEQAIAFFKTDAGKQFLAVVASLRPPFLAEGGNDIYMRRASLIEGYELCVQMLSHVLSPEFNKPIETTEEYPSLDDESKWEGQKEE